MTWFKENSLYILLPLFILAGLLAMMREIGYGHHSLYKAEGPLTGNVAHGPAEFPQVFNFDPLQGIDSSTKGELHVPRPPLSEDIFPCTQCHDETMNNATKRELTDEHVKIKLHHGDSRWCLDCHDFKDRDKLHLSSGEKIPFEESYKLCGQCHGDKYRDWKLGIHGKRTGYWNGAKRYLLCVNCHYPHDPNFKAVRPLPPPVRPEFLKTAPLGTPDPNLYGAPASPDANAEPGARVPTVAPSGAPSPSASPASDASPVAASPAVASPAVASPAASAPPSSAPTEAK